MCIFVVVFFLLVIIVFCLFFFFFKQKTAYEIDMGLEFRRVLFRSAGAGLAAGVAAAGYWGVAAAVTRPGRLLLDGRLLLCSVRTDKPLLALTFDDGPD